MTASDSRAFRQRFVPVLLLAGDTLAALAGLSLGYWLRYETPVGSLGIEVLDATWIQYLPLILIGAAFLVASYAHLNLYDEKLYLRKYQSLNLIIKGTSFWLAAYLSLSLVLKFEPPISRLFVVLAYLTTIVLMCAWRLGFYRVAAGPRFLHRLQQRTALLGWNDAARSLVKEISASPAHPFRIAGVVGLTGAFAPEDASEDVPWLGGVEELPKILSKNRIDVLIAASLALPNEKVLEINRLCERAGVEWKVIPSAFQIFISGLRLQTIGNIPILGVDDLPISRLFNRFVKRALDVTGGALGLLLSAPLIAVLAILIRRESPGPVLFRQERIGSGRKPFVMLKLRSMHLGAEERDHLHQSTPAGDPRLLRIGGFIRRWNLDELTQFWNVLMGDMSLVGPRPERPFHVEKLSSIIPHYMPRHLAKPGMTGWAQVNGLRGDGPLEQRIQHDIYYIENWSLWLDLQILIMTFLRWKNDAA